MKPNEKTSTLTARIDIEHIRAEYGTDDMYIDSKGKIRDRTTNQLIKHVSVEDRHLEKKTACAEYFRSLPIAVQNELLKVALAYKAKRAVEIMNRYPARNNSSEKWSVSYEELAKIAAEGILLGD